MEQFLKSKIGNITVSAMFTAIIAVFSQFSVMTPLGVPVTFQIFAVALCGYLLELKSSILVVVVYIIIGAVGLPVFSGFGGGLNVILGLTGGYIIGFIFLAAFCSLSVKQKNMYLKSVVSIAGVWICHFFGVCWLLSVSGNKLSLPLILTEVFFVVKDIILLSLAYLTYKTVKKVLIRR